VGVRLESRLLCLWLIQAATMPALRIAILQRLTAWKKHEDPQPPMYAWPGVNAPITQQDLLGWRAFLEGCVLQAWAAKQQDYYDWLERKKHWETMGYNFDQTPLANILGHVGTP
jgi:hypothetical protein